MFKLNKEALAHATEMAAALWETDSPSEMQINEIVLNAYEGRDDRNEFEALIGEYEVNDQQAYEDLKEEMGL